MGLSVFKESSGGGAVANRLPAAYRPERKNSPKKNGPGLR